MHAVYARTYSNPEHKLFPSKMSLCLASISPLGWIFTLTGERGEMAADSSNFTTSQQPEFRGKRQFGP